MAATRRGDDLCKTTWERNRVQCKSKDTTPSCQSECQALLHRHLSSRALQWEGWACGSCFVLNWQPASWQGTVILWMIVLPLQTLLGRVFPCQKLNDSRAPDLSFCDASHFSHLSAIYKLQVWKADNTERLSVSITWLAVILSEWDRVSHWGKREVHLTVLTMLFTQLCIR